MLRYRAATISAAFAIGWPAVAHAAFVKSAIAVVDETQLLSRRRGDALVIDGVVSPGVWNDEYPAGDWLPPQWGRLYYACVAGTDCTEDWAEIIATAGSGGCMAFGHWLDAPTTLRPPQAALTAPDPWSGKFGVVHYGPTCADVEALHALGPPRVADRSHARDLVRESRG